MDFLPQRIFDPILQSGSASEKLMQGVRYTIMRMEQRDASGMIQYYWSAIIGTERSIGFAALLRQEGRNSSLRFAKDFISVMDDKTIIIGCGLTVRFLTLHRGDSNQ
jgi:hypothetical protein